MTTTRSEEQRVGDTAGDSCRAVILDGHRSAVLTVGISSDEAAAKRAEITNIWLDVSETEVVIGTNAPSQTIITEFQNKQFQRQEMLLCRKLSQRHQRSARYVQLLMLLPTA